MRADRFPFLSAVVVSAVVLVSSNADVYAEETVDDLVSGKADWAVGVAALTVPDSTDGAVVSAASLVSRLIRDELEGVDEHLLDPRERAALACEVIEEEETDSWRRIASLRSSRDELLFDPNVDPAKFRALEEDIDEASRDARRWRNASTDVVAVPQMLPVSYPEPADGGSIWDIGVSAPESFRAKEELDVLVCGSLLRVGDYYGIRVSAWTEAGVVSLWEGAASDTEIETVSREAGAEVRSLVLGRSWCSLTVQVDPPEAVVMVDGRTRGVGYWSDSALHPGEIVLEVSAHGYEPVLIVENLAESESKTLEVELTKTNLNAVLVRSVPPGADVRLGTLWLGKTPLSVERPDRVMPLSMEKDGFVSRTVSFSPETERLTVPLESRIVDPVTEFSTARKRLYNSIALFSASLAPTIALLGISRNYANMNILAQGPPLNNDDTVYSYRAYMISYGMMWGSVAVNLGLLANVLVRLNRYLNAAENLSD